MRKIYLAGGVKNRDLHQATDWRIFATKKLTEAGIEVIHFTDTLSEFLERVQGIDIMLIHEPEAENLLPSSTTCVKIGICQERRIPMVCTTHVKYVVEDPALCNLIFKVARNLNHGIEMVGDYFDNLEDNLRYEQEKQI